MSRKGEGSRGHSWVLVLGLPLTSLVKTLPLILEPQFLYFTPSSPHKHTYMHTNFGLVAVLLSEVWQSGLWQSGAGIYCCHAAINMCREEW